MTISLALAYLVEDAARTSGGSLADEIEESAPAETQEQPAAPAEEEAPSAPAIPE